MSPVKSLHLLINSARITLHPRKFFHSIAIQENPNFSSMASSTRLMPSTSDLKTLIQSPIYSLDPIPTSSSTMDDLFNGVIKIDGGEGGGSSEFGNGEITLEEFLSKEDVRVPFGGLEGENRDQILGFGFGGGGKARGRKRAVVDVVDRAAMQRQKRMIKNRESAARSRERKQAYTGELEALVTRLEDENARLLREQEELRRQRLKQLMENLIPITEIREPRRSLRRTQTMLW